MPWGVTASRTTSPMSTCPSAEAASRSCSSPSMDRRPARVSESPPCTPIRSRTRGAGSVNVESSIAVVVAGRRIVVVVTRTA